ncbi:MAG: hypothetical protein HZB47_13005 [Nitrosomonadales bacterium]|nr:hypothetical protein [Nitrosomonadales bacterium]
MGKAGNHYQTVITLRPKGNDLPDYFAVPNSIFRENSLITAMAQKVLNGVRECKHDKYIVDVEVSGAGGIQFFRESSR